MIDPLLDVKERKKVLIHEFQPAILQWRDLQGEERWCPLLILHRQAATARSDGNLEIIKSYICRPEKFMEQWPGAGL